jgi:hypothetical protein
LPKSVAKNHNGHAVVDAGYVYTLDLIGRITGWQQRTAIEPATSVSSMTGAAVPSTPSILCRRCTTSPWCFDSLMAILAVFTINALLFTVLRRYQPLFDGERATPP